MKNCILILTTFTLTTTIFAQKVKVKKGEVLFDDNKVGYLGKTGGLRTGRTYILKTLEGDTVLIGSQKMVYSLLEKEDMPLGYVSVEFPKKNRKVGVTESEISFYDDAFAKFFINNKIFENGKPNEAAIDAFIKANPDTIPARITDIWNKEQEYLAGMSEFTDRDKSKEIILEHKELTRGEEYGKQYIYDNYEIYQDKVLIGYASVRTTIGVVNNDHLANSGAAAMYFYYNTKHIPIARLGIRPFGALRIYNGDIAIGHINQKYNSIAYPSRETKLKAVASYLVSNNKL